MNEKFRDSIGTIDEEGKRAWVFPKKPGGYFYKYRKWVSYFLLVFLFVSPFLKINGNQFLLFNVLDRKFSIFGFPFWPQDFHIFVIMMIIGVVFIVLFTVAFGRIFCGWMCPQTIFLEMVFRRIEYWIEGDRGKQMKLAKQAWNAEKIRKRLLKWIIFVLISFLIANVFLAYLIGGDRLIQEILDGPQNHLSTLISLSIFTGIFYFVFAWFREQVCIIACPYGRLQGVLLDNKSIIVAYDHKRGEREEGRSRLKKGEDREALGKGDCVDCSLCVKVCPTGIDIRNGTQLECINCTACIDACDNIMDTVGYERGLIRYASEAEIADKKKWKLSGRTLAYSVVLLLLLVAFGFLLVSRNDVEASLLRTPGMLYQKKENNKISNLYNLKIINKTKEEIPMTIKLLNMEGEIQLIGNSNLVLKPQGMTEAVLFILLDIDDLTSMRTELEIGIFSNGEMIDDVETNFMGPAN